MSSDKSPVVDFVATMILLFASAGLFMWAMSGLHGSYPGVPAIGYWDGLDVSIILLTVKSILWPGRRD